MKLEIGGEVFDSRRSAEGENQAVFAPAEDGSDLVLFVVEVRLTHTNKQPHTHTRTSTTARRKTGHIISKNHPRTGGGGGGGKGNATYRTLFARYYNVLRRTKKTVERERACVNDETFVSPRCLQLSFSACLGELFSFQQDGRKPASKINRSLSCRRGGGLRVAEAHTTHTRCSRAACVARARCRCYYSVMVWYMI